jgi:lipoprotein-releasing system permease protein
VRFIWFLALRYLKHRRTQSVITLLGVAVGIMVLTTALSLTNGFIKGLVDATLKAVPHLYLQSLDPEAKNPAPASNQSVIGQAPVLLTKALLTRRAEAGRSGRADFSTLIGLGSGGQSVYPDLDLSRLKQGKIVLGLALARSLGAYPGDKVFLVSVNQKRIVLEVVATFQTGNFLLDSGFAFTALSDAQALMETAAVSGYQLRLKDPNQAVEVGLELANTQYFSLPWQSTNATLIAQLQLQKRVIGIVVFLIVIVAALGMANVLVLTVIEKNQDIALLRVMGASARQVAGVFGLEGLILGVLGVALGNLLGWLVSSYFIWRPITIPGELYFLTRLPVEIRATDFVWVSVLSLVVVMLASLLPLFRALRIKPGEVLR